MNFKLPRIYPITDRVLSGLTHTEQTRAFAEGGASLVQLREKSAPPRLFIEDVRRAAAIARGSAVCLIINDRADIALAAGAGGVHLGQDDLPPAAARRILGENAVIGLSTHNVGQAEAAIHQGVNYIAVGPIFETGTKTDHSPVIGPEGIAAVRRSVGDLPLVAIGGITPERLAEVFDAGADSAAMIAGLLAEPARIAEVYRALEGRAGER